MRKPHRPRDPEVVSRLMRAVQSRGTRCELELRQELAALGLRFRLHVDSLPGKPDVVFPRERVAIFVDGDFWHARTYVESGIAALRASLRTERSEWWVAKLIRNAERDLLATAALQGLGYTVVRVWERDLLLHVSKTAKRIARIVERRRKASQDRPSRRTADGNVVRQSQRR